MKRGRSRASSTIRKLLLLALPATLLAGAVLVLAIELWVRTHWDYSRGTPGFYESDAIRGVMADLIAGRQSYRSLKWRLVRTFEWQLAFNALRARA